MSRVLAVAGAALLLASAAQAKGPTQVCGSTGCVDLASEAQTLDGALRLSVPAGTPTLGAVAPAPYFRISGIAGPGVWVPSANALRFAFDWVTPNESELALLREKTAGLTPFRPPKYAEVLVDWERVKNGDGYIKLATIGTPVAAAPARTRWVDVRVLGGVSPWNDGSVHLAIARNGYLLREGRVFRISTNFAKRVLARLPLG